MAMKMFNPSHPGEVLKELCLEPLGLSVTRAAEALGVTRKTLSAILNGRAGISPEMAIRLSKAFDTSAESWLSQQAQYDLWVADSIWARSASKSSQRPNKRMKLTNQASSILLTQDRRHFVWQLIRDVRRHREVVRASICDI